MGKNKQNQQKKVEGEKSLHIVKAPCIYVTNKIIANEQNKYPCFLCIQHWKTFTEAKVHAKRLYAVFHKVFSCRKNDHAIFLPSILMHLRQNIEMIQQ